jgi:D-alanyl-D-alanine carboxypeptidase (penicillin-binding protein 5/6)
MTKLILICSILLNTFGFSGQSANIDKNIVSNVAGNQQQVSASDSDFVLPEISSYPIVDQDSAQALIYAKNYILIDGVSGATLKEKQSDVQVPIASTTKIMTAVVALENYNLDDVVTISPEAANQIGATANLRIGEKMTVLNLLKCMLIKSANGAADALAENMNISGETGYSKFVNEMNKKAKSLGMMNTKYNDPAGLDVTGYSSAYDLAIITKYALRNETFASIVITKTESVKDVTGNIWHLLENSNRLVREWDYPGAIGVKTGYMPEAGHCLVGAARRDEHILIAVILNTNADTPSASAEEARKILDWGFGNVTWVD